jgi:acyl-CoA synthetase (AMP-forming)/AMP-acid ligase II
MVVSGQSPIKSLKEFIALAKAKPGGLNYASSGPGTPYHMAGELFKYMAGVDIVHVPHKGSDQARTAVLGAQVHMMFDAITTMAANARAGQVKALATTGKVRSSVLPDVPTVNEAGVPGYEATILDDDGDEVPDGQVGRLAVRGPTGCHYLDDPRQADYVQRGWNLTGDAFVRDEDGYFWYQARSDDLIISSGYNIAGPEVEDALLSHDAVAEAAVVGVPDEDRGELVKAFVVLREGTAADDATVAQLQDHVKGTIAPYKYPRAIEFRDQLPRTQTGKLQRFRLRDEER